MANTDGKFCPLCAKKAEQNKLVRYKINFTDGIYLCSKKDCVYPVGVIPLHEAIVKDASKSDPVNLVNANNNATALLSASPPSHGSTNFLNLSSSKSLHCEGQGSLPHTVSSTRTIVSGLIHSSGSTTQMTTNSKPSSSSAAFTSGLISKSTIRRNCSYASVSRSFPYYIPVPSSAKLNGKPKKYSSFVKTTVEQEQSVLSPSGSESSSRDSGFNSDASSPTPPIVSSDIDQLLDEIASLDDIN